MNLKHLAAWFSAVALLVTGATFLFAQPPQPARQAPARVDRGKLRAEVSKLRVEVEMLRFDYELARDGLLEDVKIEKGLKMAGGIMGSLSAMQVAINEQGAEPPTGDPRPQLSQQDRKKAAEAAKAQEQAKKKAAEAAEQEEKKDEAEMAAAIAERKKDLTRKFALLTEKRLDLEDAEQKYRESR